MDILAKGATYAGLVLALGAGVFARFAFPEPPPGVRRALAWGIAVGAVLVAVGAVLDVAAVLDRIARGRVDGDLVWSYVTATQHGRASALRVGLACVAAGWGLRAFGPRGADRALYATFALAWLTTAAWVGHSGAMGWGGAMASLAHLTAVVAWVGVLVWLAWLPVWSDGPDLARAVAWVGRVGLGAVVVLAATGAAMARLHLEPLSAIVDSAYGAALIAKLVLVAGAVATAAVNRLRRVPAFERGERGPLLRSVRLESALLAAVVLATAVLATRTPVHVP
jgi:putative copper export protein